MVKTTMHNNIATLRKQKGYSPAEFAKLVGITIWWLYDIESTKHSPSLSLSIKIADALGVTLDDIFLN